MIIEQTFLVRSYVIVFCHKEEIIKGKNESDLQREKRIQNRLIFVLVFIKNTDIFISLLYSFLLNEYY